MPEIQLTKGQVTEVDEADYPSLSTSKWWALLTHSGNHYAIRSVTRQGVKRKVYMHRELTSCPDGLEIDHINGDTLDNRRTNLRVCTRNQNGKNQHRRKRVGSSRYKGLFWASRDGKWRVRIMVDGRYVHLGYFQDEEEGALAYNEAAIKLHKEFASLNFTGDL